MPLIQAQLKYQISLLVVTWSKYHVTKIIRILISHYQQIPRLYDEYVAAVDRSLVHENGDQVP